MIYDLLFIIVRNANSHRNIRSYSLAEYKHLEFVIDLRLKAKEIKENIQLKNEEVDDDYSN